MTEQSTRSYETAKKFIKVNAILSLVFGILGVLVSLLFGLFGTVILPFVEGINSGDVIALIITSWLSVLVHSYLVVAGGLFLRSNPKPSLIQGLAIANIVFGAMFNYVILAFAIVSLTQLAAYRAHYKA